MAETGSGNNLQTAENVFAGGGEMGALMRANDWSKTPLGAVETWEQSLITAVRLMLNSRFSMFIWWGEKLVYLYNDAYQPTLGIHHPQALGRPAPEVWSEIWQDLEPQVRLVVERGEATWNEELLLFLERSGFKEETYHTFSYSPIIDENNKIGGLFCAVSEDTQKVLNRRRLQTLRDLGERTMAEAKTVSEACRAAAEVLSENPFDLPFAAVYMLDADGKRARLAENVRIDGSEKAAPKEIEIAQTGDVWEFERVLADERGRRIEQIDRKFGRLSAGAWRDDHAREAFIVPLAKTGTHDFPAGFLVAGISPRLVFDAEYQGFLELVAGHIATSIANAEALEAERRRVEALAELDRAKTEFFSNVSHEFRTPLTLMLGNLEEVLRRDETLPESEREQIETAHRNSLRLLKLVNNLLDFSRIEAGKTAAHFETTDLARLTAELASGFRAGIEKAGITLKVDCPPLSEPVAVDREMWEKIVLNLLSNAFKFTLRGEIEISLHETADGTVELKVRDTGVGIPADELPNIFERFHRVRNVHGRTHEGTGIGLSLVQELVRLHHGTIEAASEMGAGTIFTIRLPKTVRRRAANETAVENLDVLPGFAVKPPAYLQSYLLDSADENQPETNDNSTDPARLPAASPAKILLADDNADMRAYIARLLRQNGYAVETVADGQAALEQLRTAKNELPDLVLTDVMMPRIDGFQLLGEIRKDKRTREIPFIMLSARAGEESKIEGFEAGADDYLIKPFSARELLARVNSVIELSKMRRAVEAERKQFTENLRQSETHLQLTTEAAQIGTWQWNIVTNEIIWSPLHKKLWGYEPTAGALPFEDWSKLINKKDLKRAQKAIDKCFRGEGDYDVEYRIVPQNSDEIRWIRSTGKAVTNDAGEAVLLQGVSLDITERKQRELNAAFLFEINESLARLSNEQEIIEGASAKIGEYFDAAHCTFTEYDLKNELAIVHFDWNGGKDEINLAGTYRLADFFNEDTRAAILTGAPIIINDVYSDPRTTNLTANFDRLNVRSLARSHFLAMGALIFGISVVYDEAHQWRDDETELLQNLTTRIWARIEAVRADAALRESEERLRLATEAAQIYSWEYDAATNAAKHSANAPVVLGFDLPETIEETLGLIHPDDSERVTEGFRAAMRGEKPLQSEFRFVNPQNGEIVWVMSQGTLVYDKGNVPARAVGITQNITQRKRAEEKLETANYRFRVAEEAAKGFNYEWDLETGRVTRSESIEFVTGFRRGELPITWQSWSDLIHPDDRLVETEEEALAFIENLPEDNFGSEYRIRHKNGEYLWVLERAVLIRDAAGKIKRLIGQTVDITERKRAERNTAFLLDLSETLARHADENEIMRLVAAKIGEHFDVDHCHIDEFDKQADTVRVLYDWRQRDDGVDFAALGVQKLSDYVNEDFQRLLFAGQPFVVADVEKDPRTAPMIEALRAVNIAASLNAPHLSFGDLKFSVALISRRPRDWRDDEISLLRECAARVWTSIERVRAETALQKSEEFHSIIAELSSDWAFSARVEADGSIVTEAVTGGFTKIFGHTAESLMEAGGFPVIVHPDDLAQAAGEMEKLLAGEVISGEMRHVTKTGEIIWLQYQTRPVTDENGRVVRLFGASTDITKRRQIQQALVETAESLSRERERLNIALRTGALGVYEWRVGDEAIWWSPEVYPVYGVDAETFTPTVESLTALIHPDDREEMWRKSRECIERREIFIHEYRIVRPDGAVRWIYNRSQIGVSENGEVERIMGVAADITERKQVEEAVRKSEAEFRLLADAVPQIVWVTGEDGRVIYVNEHWTEFSRLNVEASRDLEKILECFHPEDRERLLNQWARSLGEGANFEVEARMRHHETGEFRWFLMRSEPSRDESGRIVKWFGTSTDITANKLAENRAVMVAEINQLTRQFENPASLLYVVSKVVGEYFKVRRCLFNEIFLENDLEIVHRDYCRGVESVAGKHQISDYSAITTAEMSAGQTVVNRDSKTDPRTAGLYEKIYAKNGERAYVAVPLLRENRWVASLWVSDDEPREWSKEDINLLEIVAEQVWSVVEKLRIDAALRESEKRFRNMADHAPVMVWVTDPTGFCTYLSQSWYEFTGQTPETGLGFGWLAATHPEDAKHAEDEFVRANQNQAPFRLEYRLRDKNGEYRWAIDSAQPRFGEDGEFLGYIGSVIDITERKNAEQEREKLLLQEKFLRAEAENANRLKDEFLATVSHELRTPLNSMLGWATMVRQNNFDPDLMRRAFEIVERNARNQNQIISDILDVSRIITGKLNLNLQPVNIAAAILAAIDTVRPAIDAKNINLFTHFETGAETITGDADRIQQIVWNLLSNAVKFTAAGGTVEIALTFQNDSAEISISDNGSGIEPEFLPFVFDRFRQADGKMNRRYGGLGLGLAIARHLTELHGGSISAESGGTDLGSTFKVRFPLKTRFAEFEQNGGSAAEPDSETMSTIEDPPQKLLGGLKILVVDDEPDALELVAFILSEQNASVFAADSVDKALELYETETFDALVSDIGMPEKDGFELMRQLKSRTNGSNSPLPTIALTAYARQEDSRRVLEAGFNAYLPKPVEPVKLIESVIEITRSGAD